MTCDHNQAHDQGSGKTKGIGLKKRLSLGIFKEGENKISHKMKVHGIKIMNSQNPQVAFFL
jgi:ribosomal protein L31E